MNASAHLSWRHANSHRVWTVICTHMCTHKCTHMCTYIGMCEGWDAHTQQSHTHSRKSLCSVGSLQFFFFPSQFHACSLHKCFFYTCVLMVMSVLWEECSRAEAWMSPMFGSWWQLVALQCSVGSKERLCMQQSTAVWCEPTFSTLKWCPKSGGRRSFITVWFRLIRTMPASVCPGSREKGVANVALTERNVQSTFPKLFELFANLILPEDELQVNTYYFTSITG